VEARGRPGGGGGGERPVGFMLWSARAAPGDSDNR
jgi:hypothetical protein